MTYKFLIIWLFCFIFYTIPCITSESEKLSGDTLNVLTFNLFGKPESEWPTRLGMVLDELEIHKPDIIAFQEVVQTPGSEGIDNTARVIAESLFVRTGIGYDYIFEYTHFSWGTLEEGIAILSPHIILENDMLSLPAGLFNRKVLHAQLLTPHGIINLFNTHLSFGNQEDVRIKQVDAIKNFILDKTQGGIAALNILCGDFNSIPDSPPILLLTQTDSNNVYYLDSWDEINPDNSGFTMPSDAPDARIDYIFLKNDERGEILDSYLVFDQSNQEMLYPSDHIGVLSTFSSIVSKIDVEIISPLKDEVINGQYLIEWTHSPLVGNYTSALYLSRNSGKNWELLWSGINADTSYSWNTLQVPDGTTYLLRVAVYDDSNIGIAQSQGSFIVNNPGNAPPEIELKSPIGGETITGTFLIRWTADDADGDVLLISLDFSMDDGSTWKIEQEGLSNSGSYMWDTRGMPNSSLYRIRLRCTDDSVEVEQISKRFSIQNARTALNDSIFSHIAGNGSGTVVGNIVDPSKLTGDLYRITFDDTLFNYTSYNVYDVDKDIFVVQNAFELDGITEGPLFDGLRLIIFDYTSAVVDQTNTGWLIGNTTLTHSISIPRFIIGSELIEGFPYPADYKLTMFDEVVDTSSTFLDVPAVPMKFKVENMTEDRPVEIMFIELDNNFTISINDQIYILEKNQDDETILTWYIVFSGFSGSILPEPGDEFVLSTLKPFIHKDVFEFRTPLSELDRDDNQKIYTYQLIQNYPNPFNPTTTIEFALPKTTEVSLKIFNILGEEITTLVFDRLTAGSYKYEWSCTGGMASGIYLYRLRAGEFVETRKMVLMR